MAGFVCIGYRTSEGLDFYLTNSGQWVGDPAQAGSFRERRGGVARRIVAPAGCVPFTRPVPQLRNGGPL